MGATVSREADTWCLAIQVDVPDKQAQLSRSADGSSGLTWASLLPSR